MRPAKGNDGNQTLQLLIGNHVRWSQLDILHITLHSRKSWLSTCISDCMSQDMPREVLHSLIQTKHFFWEATGAALSGYASL